MAEYREGKLSFPQEFFNNEVRDGFTVNELMKRNWAAQLELLLKVEEICDKYNLKYYLYWGTLLGAVRHGGYIPWDDDLDIAMTGEDYVRFLEVAEAELPAGCKIYNPYTTPECTEIFTRITTGEVLNTSEGYMRQYHNCPLVVGIDLFPLYYVPKDAGQAQVLKVLLGYVTALTGRLAEENGETELENDADVEEILAEMERITGFCFSKERPLMNQLAMLYDRLGRMCSAEDGDAVTSIHCWLANGYQVEKKMLGEEERLSFEGLSLRVPCAYDAILRMTFKDYMQPIRGTAMHDYPYYKGQLETLGDYIGQLDRKRFFQMAAENAYGKNVTDAAFGQEVPEAWKERINGGKEGKRRKVLLYRTSAEELLCHGEAVKTKLQSVFTLLKGKKDIVLWWSTCRFDYPELSFLKKAAPQFLTEYEEMLELYQRESIGIMDISGDMQRAIAMADGYFGDAGEMQRMASAAGKPVMIQNYEIVN